jgi:hypothetical protein
MKPTRTFLVGVAAALSVIAIAAPVSTAGAATIAPVTIESTRPNYSPPVALPIPDQNGTVTGPRFVGSATFTDLHIVESSGNASVGS